MLIAECSSSSRVRSGADAPKEGCPVKLAALALLLLAWPAAPAAAQYPTNAVQFIITFPPGGPGDTTIRLIHPALQQHLGGAIELVNKPGAGGATGYTYVAKAKPDGYTILSTMSAPLTVGTALQPLAFGLDDFEYVGAYAFDATAIVTLPDPRWKTLDDLLQHVKANPGKLTYATSGATTTPYLAMEAIKIQRGLDLPVVQQQGSGPVRTAVLGGHVDVGVGGFSVMKELIRAGKLQALAITGRERDAKFPEVPTLAEKGLSEANVELWAGLWAPKGTAKSIVDALTRALEQTIKDPAVAAKVEAAGYRAAWLPPGPMKELARRDHDNAVRIARALGIQKK
jgi:tripartite-type tricarboxylate transporter receptor subunit TctC